MQPIARWAKSTDARRRSSTVSTGVEGVVDSGSKSVVLVDALHQVMDDFEQWPALVWYAVAARSGPANDRANPVMVYPHFNVFVLLQYFLDVLPRSAPGKIELPDIAKHLHFADGSNGEHVVWFGNRE